MIAICRVLGFALVLDFDDISRNVTSPIVSFADDILLYLKKAADQNAHKKLLSTGGQLAMI